MRRGLVLYTFGNASGVDREQGLVVIKPSGVDYDALKPERTVTQGRTPTAISAKAAIIRVRSGTDILAYRVQSEIDFLPLAIKLLVKIQGDWLT